MNALANWLGAILLQSLSLSEFVNFANIIIITFICVHVKYVFSFNIISDLITTSIFPSTIFCLLHCIDCFTYTMRKKQGIKKNSIQCVSEIECKQQAVAINISFSLNFIETELFFSLHSHHISIYSSSNKRKEKPMNETLLIM